MSPLNSRCEVLSPVESSQEFCAFELAGHLALQEALAEKMLTACAARVRYEQLSSKPLPCFPEPSPSKAHWQYLLEEMSWLANDFVRERKWR